MGERGLRSPGDEARARDQRSREWHANGQKVLEPFGDAALFDPQPAAGEAKNCGGDRSALCFGVERFERLFLVLELALIVIFVLLLIAPGELRKAFAYPWFLLWLVAFASMVPGLSGVVTTRRDVASNGAVAVRSSRAVAWVALLVLVGVLALRAAVIFSAQ